MGKPINKQLNSQQHQAVQQVISGDYRPFPYVILGPPGTGKTTVDIECMLQLLSQNNAGSAPVVRILACAPSNSATDLFVTKLSSHVKPDRMFRFNGYNRKKESMQDQSVMSYSNYDEGGKCFPAKSLSDFEKFEVVAVTVTHSTELISLGLTAGHFTHIFIDECGHADETECLIPLAGLITPETCVVLSGDPKQLGPQIRSPIANKFGLGVSWLERLVNDQQEAGELAMPKDKGGFVISTIEDSPYARSDAHMPTGHYNCRYITKLLNNYRSHADLLIVANQLFYHSELKPCAPVEQQTKLTNFLALPNKQVPLIFVGTDGQNCQEADSASFFNRDEVTVVIRQVKALITQYPPEQLSRGEIGIITPYRKQVQKLKSAIGMMKLSAEIKVGTVEEFQGQERSVIIISTVRSHLGVDVDPENKSSIGFLANPKRFNVAVTRAKSLLIVVGDPAMLKQDPCWLALLRYAREKQAYMGVSWTDPAEAEEEKEDDSEAGGSEDDDDDDENPLMRKN